MSDTFWQRGFAVVEDMVSPLHLAMLTKGMDVAHEQGGLNEEVESLAIGSSGAYSPVPGEMLLRHCRSRFEGIIGRDLIEHNAYWRWYRSGSSLRAHKDRTGCEITASVTIDSPSDAAPWPLMVTDLEGTTHSVMLPPGAGVVFLGSDLEHWGEPLEADWQKQLFLHYVIKDGDFAHRAFDQRGADPLVRVTV
ncbi:MAG: hypothetical protein AAF127_11660 [Pseudomonadota bacterium]